MRILNTLSSLLCLGFLMACGGGEGGSSNNGPVVDCRAEGNGCTGDFGCQMNADGAYECLPSNQGGSAGSGGNEAGAAGQGGNSGNEAGQGGNSGNEAGQGGSAR